MRAVSKKRKKSKRNLGEVTLPKKTPKISVGKKTFHFTPFNVALGSFAVAVVGTGTYLGYQYFKNNASKDPNQISYFPDGSSNSKPKVSSGTSNSTSSSTNSSAVTTTVARPPVFSASALKTQLIKAIANISFTDTMAVLKQINTVDQYSAVQRQVVGANGIQFTGDSVRKSILTKCFEVFGTNPNYRTQLTNEFIRIGLKPPAVAGGAWSLKGLGSVEYGQVITIKPSMLKTSTGEFMTVGKNNVLGREISRANGLSMIETLTGEKIVVETANIKPFES